MNTYWLGEASARGALTGDVLAEKKEETGARVPDEQVTRILPSQPALERACGEGDTVGYGATAMKYTAHSKGHVARAPRTHRAQVMSPGSPGTD